MREHTDAAAHDETESARDPDGVGPLASLLRLSPEQTAELRRILPLLAAE